MVGSPVYMSPEVNLYSLLVIFKLLFGQDYSLISEV